MQAFFPAWLPYWAQVSLIGGVSLLLCAVLLMPFAVFGLKSRLHYIEAQLEDVQTALRVIASRLPQRGTEGATPSLRRIVSDEEIFDPQPLTRTSYQSQEGSPKNPDPQSNPQGHSPLQREEIFTPQAENGLTPSVLNSTDAYQPRSPYTASEEGRSVVPDRASSQKNPLWSEDKNATRQRSKEEASYSKESIYKSGYREIPSSTSFPHKAHSEEKFYVLGRAEETLEGKARMSSFRERDHLPQEVPLRSPGRGGANQSPKREGYFAWKSTGHSFPDGGSSSVSQRVEPQLSPNPFQGEEQRDEKDAIFSPPRGREPGFGDASHKRDHARQERREPGLRWPPSS
ncbi:hypothetical protein [Entomobacter blattae]|uniref:Uncharacterized protein n=1 Tax=Entomobacter blattae TaxID=2762277 RepID=A0A7H1NNQ5_9PROT|nr:hypothetical protein [Entomobacter blattae]QNT77415.1 hypothetical protein JGUZn3_01500 [Entomobacter blattae]